MRFDNQREADRRSQQEFSRAAVEGIRSLHANTTQTSLNADVLRNETRQMMGILAHQQSHCQDPMSQRAQQLVNTQTQANAWDTWWESDM